MLSDNQKISAIVWAAKRQGLSYGEFSVRLTEERSKQIYKEYENYLIMKQETGNDGRRKYRKGNKTDRESRL